MAFETVSGTPTKLRDGSWGVKVTGTAVSYLPVGRVVTANVRTKAGKTWSQESKVLWTGNGVALLTKVGGNTSRNSRTSFQPTDGCQYVAKRVWCDNCKEAGGRKSWCQDDSCVATVGYRHTTDRCA